MAKRIPDDERQRIIAAFATGASCNQIAKEFGRSSNTISRIARSVGHQFAQVNTLRAREVKRAYDAEWRANAIAKWAKAHDDILGRLYEPTLVYSFGGKFNEYSEHTLAKPDAKAVRDIVNSASVAWRTIEAIDKADNGGADDPLNEFVDLLKEERATRRKKPDEAEPE